MFSRKETVRQKVVKSSHKLDPEIKEAFQGQRTFISLLTYIVGGVLIANSISTILITVIGHRFTFVLGLILFFIGGIISKEFRR